MNGSKRVSPIAANPDDLQDGAVFELSRDQLDSLPYGVITLDRAGKIVRFNYAEAAFSRRTIEGTLGREFFTDVAPCTNVQAFKGRFDEFARHFDSGIERFDFTFAFRWGSQDVSITLLRKAEHDEINLIVRGRAQAALDIAPSALSGRDLVREEAMQSLVNASTPALGALELESPAAWEVGSPEETAWRAMIHPDDAEATRGIIAAAADRRRAYGIEYRLIDAQKKLRVVQEHGGFGRGRYARAFATITDVTERRRRETDLWRLAHFDPVTGLPNRTLLCERVAAAAAEASDTGRVVAILSLSVCRSGSLNESLGEATADAVLRLLALRLGESIRGGDTVARFNERAFVVLLTDLDDVASAEGVARRIMENVSEPFTVQGRVHRLSASLGISLSPRNGSDAVALLQAAETAMFAATKKSSKGIAWFTTDLAAEVEDTTRIEDELRLALERDEFCLHYQPIVDITSGRVIAVEALVRWNHPSRGLVMPNSFIAVAERIGLIVALGSWVLREAARQVREWMDAGVCMQVCVNVSLVQFRAPGFSLFVTSILAEANVPARMLELEVTESVMVDGFSEVIETLGDLKLTGVRLAIDDFGTGYSSLAYLKYFPIDTLKIDRAFVADIVNDTYDRAIARAVLTLAADLRIDCIAEGVETEEQLEMLRELGCRRVQGFYFSRPQAPGDLDFRTLPACEIGTGATGGKQQKTLLPRAISK